MKTTHQQITLNFETLGAGPAIVFIHDGAENQAILDPHLAALAKAGFRVIVTNLRGLPPGGAATVDDLTGDAVTLLNVLGIGRAVIFGIGRGGCVLLNLLERHPERVVASSLVIPSVMAEALHRYAGRNSLRALLQGGRSAPLIRELFNALPALPARRPTMADLPGLRAWIEQMAKLSQRPKRSSLALLAELQLPLLILDTVTTPAKERWRQRLGGRLRACSNSLLALLDLLLPGEGEEFNEEVCGELP